MSKSSFNKPSDGLTRFLDPDHEENTHENPSHHLRCRRIEGAKNTGHGEGDRQVCVR